LAGAVGSHSDNTEESAGAIDLPSDDSSEALLHLGLLDPSNLRDSENAVCIHLNLKVQT
jgi:hypothetical protein